MISSSACSKTKKAAGDILNRYKIIINKSKAKAKINKRTQLEKAASHKHISKILKNQESAQMGAIERPEDDTQGNKKGPLATEMDEIFTILRKVWGNITNGNPTDLEVSADKFIEKYENTSSKLMNTPLMTLTLPISSLLAEHLLDLLQASMDGHLKTLRSFLIMASQGSPIC